MKTLVLVITAALTLTGCAHNGSWVAPAVAGAVVGVVIHEASQQQSPRHYHQPPVYYRAPPPPPRHCYSVSLYDYYGRYAGARVECR